MGGLQLGTLLNLVWPYRYGQGVNLKHRSTAVFPITPWYGRTHRAWQLMAGAASCMRHAYEYGRVPVCTAAGSGIRIRVRRRRTIHTYDTARARARRRRGGVHRRVGIVPS
eukprot:SAG31_NODE_765_length_12248_cov_6.802947_2_plen_111_part_00